MPFEYAWTRVLSDCSEVQLEGYLDSQKPYLKMKSQQEPCGVCVPRFYEHTMHYIIYMCNSKTCAAVMHGSRCEWFAKSTMCNATKKCHISQHGYHLSSAADPGEAKLNLTMKRFIRDKTDERVKPSRILNMMIDRFNLDNASEYLPRVQRYSHYYRTAKLADSNNIDDMEAIIASQPYHDGLDEGSSFAFAFAVGTNGEPFITTGSSDDPFVVGFSSKRLIRNLAFAATNVLHIDATFKLNTCSFPVVILGVSDAARKFHPIGFFITSDLKQPQIEHILRATIRQYKLITNALPAIKYVMADADNAQRNAIEAVVAEEIPSASPVFLMCFFHVMKNVKDYMKGMSAESRLVVFKHIYCIHYARTEVELGSRIFEAVSTWRQRQDCLEFEKKFSGQWLVGRFTKWQCLSAPPGYAKTNNPVEQFNKILKRDYTLRQRLNVNMLAQELLNVSKHQAARIPSFESSPIPTEDIVTRYKHLVRNNRIVVSSWYRSSLSFIVDDDERRRLLVVQRGEDFVMPRKRDSAVIDEEARVGEFSMETHEQPSSGWLVDVDGSICPCRTWFNFGYCIHIIAARVHIGLYVEGVTKKRKFATKKKVGAKGKHVGHALSRD